MRLDEEFQTLATGRTTERLQVWAAWISDDGLFFKLREALVVDEAETVLESARHWLSHKGTQWFLNRIAGDRFALGCQRELAGMLAATRVVEATRRKQNAEAQDWAAEAVRLLSERVEERREVELATTEASSALDDVEAAYGRLIGEKWIVGPAFGLSRALDAGVGGGGSDGPQHGGLKSESGRVKTIRVLAATGTGRGLVTVFSAKRVVPGHGECYAHPIAMRFVPLGQSFRRAVNDAAQLVGRFSGFDIQWWMDYPEEVDVGKRALHDRSIGFGAWAVFGAIVKGLRVPKHVAVSGALDVQTRRLEAVTGLRPKLVAARQDAHIRAVLLPTGYGVRWLAKRILPTMQIELVRDLSHARQVLRDRWHDEIIQTPAGPSSPNGTGAEWTEIKDLSDERQLELFRASESVYLNSFEDPDVLEDFDHFPQYIEDTQAGRFKYRDHYLVAHEEGGVLGMAFFTTYGDPYRRGFVSYFCVKGRRPKLAKNGAERIAEIMQREQVRFMLFEFEKLAPYWMERPNRLGWAVSRARLLSDFTKLGARKMGGVLYRQPDVSLAPQPERRRAREVDLHLMFIAIGPGQRRKSCPRREVEEHLGFIYDRFYLDGFARTHAARLEEAGSYLAGLRQDVARDALLRQSGSVPLFGVARSPERRQGNRVRIYLAWAVAQRVRARVRGSHKRGEARLAQPRAAGESSGVERLSVMAREWFHDLGVEVHSPERGSGDPEGRANFWAKRSDALVVVVFGAGALDADRRADIKEGLALGRPVWVVTRAAEKAKVRERLGAAGGGVKLQPYDEGALYDFALTLVGDVLKALGLARLLRRIGVQV